MAANGCLVCGEGRGDNGEDFRVELTQIGYGLAPPFVSKVPCLLLTAKLYGEILASIFIYMTR